ncbi:hypothetical protein GPA27_20700 [Aromatoleum toluolicum]|uniref:Uncharacterized protein n=1 Tax=Aromatoleum toluolicum TaxID=90060 RepID=A0ABX1NKN7_9RHOO|nr:hypothetical protein [Aromatoleum toluolicum]NMF99801.1 hypothetical protein [Aromatoleum toluolicum]
MSGFEHFERDACQLEREILKRGIVLELDWDDAAGMRKLAREALQGGADHTQALLADPDARLRARGELFALGVLMLRVMEESADTGVHTHGGPAWKAFGRALIQEAQAEGKRVAPRVRNV